MVPRLMGSLLNLSRAGILVVTLAQVSCCASDLVPAGLVAKPARMEGNAQDLRGVVHMPDATRVTVEGEGDLWTARTFTTFGDRGVRVIAELPEERPHSCMGERLVARSEGGWWYSRCAETEQGVVVRFLSSDLRRDDSKSIHLDPRSVKGWLPLEGDDAAGVLLTTDPGGSTRMRVFFVSPGSESELQPFESRGFLGVESGGWQAARSEDGRIILVSVEQDAQGRNSQIILRVFSPGGSMTETLLPFDSSLEYLYVNAASSGGGDLAVVVVSEDDSVIGMTLNIDAETQEQPVTLSAEDGAALPRPGVTLVSTSDRFVVSWIGTASRGVWLAEMAPGAKALPLQIATSADRRAAFLGLQHLPEENRVLLSWAGADGLMFLGMPDPPVSYLVAAEMWQLIRTLLSGATDLSDPCL